MEVSQLGDLIRSRSSIRRWQDKEVPEDLLMRAVDLATWAPNAANQQNWHFYVIVRRGTIKAIADVVQASADLVASWPKAKDLGYVGRWQRNASFFRSAPAAIAVAATQYQSLVDHILSGLEKTDPQAAQMRQWRNTGNSRIQSVASAISHLLLILHCMGLGAVWMTGPLQAKGEIEKILKMPPGQDLVAFIPVGFPAESPTQRERRPVGDVCTILR